MKIKERKLKHQTDLVDIIIERSAVKKSFLKLLDRLHVNYWFAAELELVLKKIELKALVDELRATKHHSALADGLNQIYRRHRVVLKGNDFKLDLTVDPAVMAILNTSPDSFFDGDPSLNDRQILERVESMMANNTKIIDLGGQSTRPGYQEITPEVEIARTVPYVKMIKRAFPEAIISVDSYKPKVIEAILDAGADIVNDINGFEDGDAKLKLVAKYHPALIAMYNNRISKWAGNDLESFFKNRKQTFKRIGIKKDNWVIDPGVGFVDHDRNTTDIELIRQLKALSELKVPTLVAISRKSMFKRLFGIDATKDIWSSLVAEQAMVKMGGQILRVHDFKETNLMLQIRKQLQAPLAQD